MFKPSSAWRVPTTLKDFFESWLIILRPYHGLTDRQIKLAATFLKARYELSKVISDEKILNETLLNTSVKERIMTECGFEPAHFRVLMGDLRKRRFFIDNHINPKWIPRLALDKPEDFSLMFLFEIQDDTTGKSV